MGKSPTIQAMESKPAPKTTDKPFSVILEQKYKDLQKPLEEANRELDRLIKERYAKYDLQNDVMILFTGEHKHVSALQEWSPAYYQKEVTAMREVLLGKTPPPPGVKLADKARTSDGKMDLTKVDIRDAMKDREDYICNRVSDIVTNTFARAASSTGTSLTSRLESKPILPGLTMFIAVIQDYFTDTTEPKYPQVVVQDIITYRIGGCLKQGKEEGEINDLELWESMKAQTRLALTEMNGKLMNLMVGADLKDPMIMFTIQTQNTLLKTAKKALTYYDKQIKLLGGSAGDKALDGMSEAEEIDAMTAKAIDFGDKVMAAYERDLEK